MPMPNSAGIIHVAKHQNSTASPTTSPRVASTIGDDAISAIRAAATTVMAKAPIETQYGGLKSRASKRKVIIRNATNKATATYRITPSDHAKTAVIANASRTGSSCGSSVAARTATDWAPTTQTNHDPPAHSHRGRVVLPTTARPA